MLTAAVCVVRVVAISNRNEYANAGAERGAAALGADGAGSGDKFSAPAAATPAAPKGDMSSGSAAALAPPAAAKGDRATAGAGVSAAAAAPAAKYTAASPE